MEFADPHNNVLQLGLKDGMKVGDLGSGSGHYAFSAAAVVGDTGTVYAVDIQQDILTHIKNVAQMRGIKNIETIWGDIERPGGTKLKDQVLDAVILSNTLFQIRKQADAIAEIKRILKPGGKLLVIDWAGAFEGMGPPEDMVMPESQAEALFTGAGFQVLKAFPGGPHHYSIVFTAS